MEKNTTPKKKRKLSTKKKVVLLISIPLFLFILLYGIVIFMLVKNDPSGSDPLYTGSVIRDENQHPIQNKFSHTTTAMEVIEGVDLRGKVIVMTGGHTGTGREAAKAFISAGATVIALTPDVAWAQKNLEGLPNVEIEHLDLLKPATIDTFTKKFLKSNRPVDALINSAGIHNTPLQRDERGYERQFAVNVLGILS